MSDSTVTNYKYNLLDNKRKRTVVDEWKGGADDARTLTTGCSQFIFNSGITAFDSILILLHLAESRVFIRLLSILLLLFPTAEEEKTTKKRTINE
jgi:hypothetical protein